MPVALPIELLAVLLGGLITLAGTAVFNWRKRRINQNRLYRALANEVELMGSSLEKLAVSTHFKIFPETEIPEDEFEYIDEEYAQRLEHPEYHPLNVLSANRDAVFPTDVFESNADQIGVIDSTSAESLIVFYSRIRQIKNTLEELENESEINDLGANELIAVRKLNSLAKNALKLRRTVLDSLDVDRSTLSDDMLSWTDYERMCWKRGQKYANCERCGAKFDVSDGYATIEMGQFPAAAIPEVSGRVYNFALCGHCHDRFGRWLDRGAVEHRR